MAIIRFFEVMRRAIAFLPAAAAGLFVGFGVWLRAYTTGAMIEAE